MVDGVPITTGVDATIATDDITDGGVADNQQVQRIKPGFGTDGNFTDTSDTTPFPIVSKGGFVSTNNSTTAPLAGAATFTGVGDDVTHFSSVSLSWNSDVDSADLGVLMQFSTDNTNWDTSIPVSAFSDDVQADFGGRHRQPITAQFFRVVFTNGAAAQASFRLQVLYHSDNSLIPIIQGDQQVNTGSDVVLTRPLTLTSLDLAREHISGQRSQFIFGINLDVDSAVFEDIHPVGGDITFLTTATTIEVLSSDAADTSAGLGARSVDITGLDATGAQVQETIATNGVTPVVSSNSYIRINKVNVQDSGTYGGANQGDITIRPSGGGATLGCINGFEGAVDTSVQYGTGESANGYFSVPLGKVMYFTGGRVHVNTVVGKTADVALYRRENLLDSTAPVSSRRLLWAAFDIQGQVEVEFHSHRRVRALSDVFFRAQASDDDTKIDIYLEFFLVDQDSDGK